MRNYQKLTLVTAILGSVIPVFGLFLYFFVNSIIGIPLLALVLGSALIGAFITIAINIGAIVAAFKIKNTWRVLNIFSLFSSPNSLAWCDTRRQAIQNPHPVRKTSQYPGRSNKLKAMPLIKASKIRKGKSSGIFEFFRESPSLKWGLSA